MPAQFVPLQAGSGLPIPMQQPILLIGRHPEADIRIDSPAISRRHCCLAVVNNRVLVRDLGSRHGVQLNGRRVEEAEIRPGDELAIGHMIYRFEADAPAPAQPPRPAPPEPPPSEPEIILTPVDENFEEELIPLDD